MKKKKPQSPKTRNHLVRLMMFRKSGVHGKSNKALRRAENAKRLYPIVYNLTGFVYNRIQLLPIVKWI